MTLESKQNWFSISESCNCGCFPSLEVTTESNALKRRILWITLILLGNLVVAELIIGFWSHSLSLTADAGHLTADIASLGLTLAALWFSKLPPTKRASFGHSRIETLSAFINGLGLVFISLWIGWESVARLQTPEAVAGVPMLIGAILGLVTNIISISLLHNHSHDDLNIRGALLHMFADAASSLSILVAAVIIYFCHWSWMDAVTGLLVAVLTGISALPLLHESAGILLEYAPSQIDLDEIESTLLSLPEVEQVAKLHVWAISPGQVLLATHLQVKANLDSRDRDLLLLQVRMDLKDLFGIETSLIEIVSTPHKSASVRSVNQNFLLNPNLSRLVLQSNPNLSTLAKEGLHLTSTVRVHTRS